MPILKVTVENADELLNTSMLGAGALGRVERSATGGGAGYSEVTTFPLISGTRLYTVYDLAGAVSSWYRVRFSTSAGASPSAYGDEFQAGDETGGLLCSLYDVYQELGDASGASLDTERIFNNVRQVTTAIEGYTGRWFSPRPLSGTTTYRVHSTYGRTLRLPKGIRSITTLRYATEDQPESGGTYTTATATDYYLDPPEMERSQGWPPTRVCLRTQASAWFYTASYGIEITGAFGWSAVPEDIQGVALRASVRRYMGKAAAVVATGPAGTEFLLPDMSGADRGTLDFYRDWPVG